MCSGKGMLLKVVLALLVLLTALFVAVFLHLRRIGQGLSMSSLLVSSLGYLLLILSAVSYILLSPLFYLYGLALCAVAWRVLGKKGKDVLVVHTAARNPKHGCRTSFPWLNTEQCF